MSDSTYIIAFFAILAAGKVVILIQFFRSRRHAVESSPSTSDMETGPEVLVEDPMTQRLLMSGVTEENEGTVDIQVLPPAYTIKDEHLEFENDPPPPSFAEAVPSSSSPWSSHPSKFRRKSSRGGSGESSSGGSRNNISHCHHESRHQLFRYRPSQSSNTDNSNNSNNNSPSSISSDRADDILHNALSVDPVFFEPAMPPIPNVARWVAESRRDTYLAYVSSEP